MRKKNLLDNRKRNYSDITNELKFDLFEEEIRQNKFYTEEKIKLFQKRDSVQKFSPVAIKENQKVLLTNIRSVFRNHQTNYKIVISPLYNQLKLNPADLKYMKELFGENNVYDFSGINKITEDYRNYYEPSHYRPDVANEIMKEIYSGIK